MKKHDVFLFFLPAAAGFLVLVFAIFFFFQLLAFEKAYREDAEKNLRQETELVARILEPMLDSGKIQEAIAFCRDFK